MDSTTQAQISTEETSQAKARAIVMSLGSIYLLIAHLFLKPAPSLAFWVIWGYMVFSWVWLFIVSKDNNAPLWRRIVVLLGDLGINTFVLFLFGDIGFFTYPMYLWIVVGYGVRYGQRFLLAAMVIGAFLFGMTLLWSGFWQQQFFIGLGMWSGLIILPLVYLSLIRRLHATNRSLGEAFENSQVAIKAKSAFMANMSHELRTPMHGVIGTAELMQMTELDNTQREYMELIQSSAKSLLTIINDLLDFSQMEAGKLRLLHEPLDLRDLIKKTYRLFESQTKAKKLEFYWEADPEIPKFLMGDDIRIHQILFNLVGNAVKYTLRGYIWIKAQLVEQDGDKVVIDIRIEDSGIGIPKSSIQEIFEEFERVGKHRERRFAGTGLGLPISQNLAQLMGGSITAESELGHGSIFTVRLQLQESAKGPQSSLQKPGDAVKTYPLHALVVEDTHVNQVITKAFLKRLGITSEIAQNGFEAQKRSQAADFDLILMDFQLPGMNGDALARWIRDHETTEEQIPIIALTANVSPQDREICLEAGMDHFLEKPLTFEALQGVMVALENADRFSNMGSPND